MLLSISKRQWLSLTQLIATTMLLSACSGSDTHSNQAFDVSPTTAKASQVFENGKIYTLNPQQRWAEAMAIEGDTIVYVGSNDGARAFVDDRTMITDLQGSMVLPGLHDVHTHPIESASDNTLFTLDDQQPDAERFAAAITQAADDNPHAKWLIGYGHSLWTLLQAEREPIDILDDIVRDQAVIIMEQTSHSMWVNSKALALAGIDSNSDDPIGGKILRKANSSRPNGILIDNAGNLVMDIAMQPNTQTQKRDYDGLVNYTLPQLAKFGITSISDARSFWRRDDHLTWLKARDNHQLTVRVNVGLWAYPSLDDETQLAALSALYSNDPNSLLKFNQIKVYSDGLLSNTTAAMHEPYNTDLIGLSDNRGLNYFSETRLARYIKTLEAVGFDFHIHAIGDRGIHQALNAIEQGGSDKGRHRLTHLEVVDPTDLPRFAELNVSADAQVAGDFTNPEHWAENDALIGPNRADNLVPIKSLVAAGARLTLSSDWNVSPLNPFVGLQNALTRDPQAVSLEQALRAYTINGAYVMRQQDKVGSIEVGKLADFIVIDRNLFEVDKNTIAQTKVLMTYLNGKPVYRRH